MLNSDSITENKTQLDFVNFNALANLNWESTELVSENILKVLSSDLSAITIDILEKNFSIIDKIVDEKKFFFELAVLCKDKSYSHPEWSLLSGRLRMLYIKRTTPNLFSETVKIMQPILDKKYYQFCLAYSKELDKILNPDLDWNFDIFAVETLYKGYLTKIKDVYGIGNVVEGVQSMYLRMASFLWYPDLNAIKTAYKDYSEGIISGPSPLQFNAGLKRPQMASCYLLSISDSMQSISKSWHDTAIISMNNGGMGVAFDALRHSEIGHQGYSRGVVPWIKIENEILATVDQAGKRKGSGTMYLTDWHSDIFEFVDAKKPVGKEELRARGLFYGLMISDEFMRRVRHDQMWSLVCPAKTNELYKKYGVEFEISYLDIEKNGLEGKYAHAFRQVKARELWKHILISQIITGMPFILYKDAINRKTNQKNLGTTRTSNLCVHGDTKILTKEGQIPIKTLENKKVEVWNGEEWSCTTVKKTGENKNLLRVKLSNGTIINCTPEHKFHIRCKDGSATVIEAQNLKINYKLVKFNLPQINKIDPLKLLELDILYHKQNKSYKETLELFYELQTVGVKSSICQIKNNFFARLPPHELAKMKKLGFDITLPENTPDYNSSYCSCSSAKILSIEKGYQNVDTFCFSEPKKHMGVFNGVLLGNCTEITEYVDDDNIATCNLSSIPISKCVKYKDGNEEQPYFDFDELGETVRRTMRNLKQMIDRNYYPEDIPQIKYTNFRNRPIGVGIQDLAGCFAKMDLIWNSEEAKQLNERIAATMYFHGMDENVKMAKEFGAYETFQGSPASKGYFQFDLWSLEKLGKTEDEVSYKDLPKDKYFDYEFIREETMKFGWYFSLVFSQMPTASSAHILGNNESHEPYTRLMYARTVLSGQFIVSVNHFVKDMEKIGLWNDLMLKHLFQNQGSIQTFSDEGLDGPTKFRLKYLKEKYKTVFELKQRLLADMYLSRAKYQCQSSSNNVFMANPTLTSLSAYHFHMWKNGAKTGQYYLHQSPKTEPMNFSLDSLHVSSRKNIKQKEVGECLVCGS
jgi:ribonucleotide reductase alpha subunit